MPDGTEISELIKLFEPINPTAYKLYGNKTERGAMERLLKQIGRPKLEAVIKALPEIIVQSYAPRITTPYQLERKFGELMVFVRQEKNKGSKVMVI